MVRDARAKVSILSPCAAGFCPHRVGPTGRNLKRRPPAAQQVSEVSLGENRHERTMPSEVRRVRPHAPVKVADTDGNDLLDASSGHLHDPASRRNADPSRARGLCRVPAIAGLIGRHDVLAVHVSGGPIGICSMTRELDAPVQAVVDQVGQVGLVHATQHEGVDLDRTQPARAAASMPSRTSPRRSRGGDRREVLGIQRISRNVDARLKPASFRPWARLARPNARSS